MKVSRGLQTAVVTLTTLFAGLTGCGNTTRPGREAWRTSVNGVTGHMSAKGAEVDIIGDPVVGILGRTEVNYSLKESKPGTAEKDCSRVTLTVVTKNARAEEITKAKAVAVPCQVFTKK